MPAHMSEAAPAVLWARARRMSTEQAGARHARGQRRGRAGAGKKAARPPPARGAFFLSFFGLQEKPSSCRFFLHENRPLPRNSHCDVLLPPRDGTTPPRCRRPPPGGEEEEIHDARVLARLRSASSARNGYVIAMLQAARRRAGTRRARRQERGGSAGARGARARSRRRARPPPRRRPRLRRAKEARQRGAPKRAQRAALQQLSRRRAVYGHETAGVMQIGRRAGGRCAARAAHGGRRLALLDALRSRGRAGR